MEPVAFYLLDDDKVGARAAQLAQLKLSEQRMSPIK
jgi:hypothetical protein